MKAKIFSFVKVSDSSIVASVRIARFIRDVLQLPLVWDESIADEALDVLIIVNGAYAFAGNELLGALGQAIEEADRVIWVQNDYTVIPPKHTGNAESPFRKAFRVRYANGLGVDYWTTVKMMTRPGLSQSGHLVGDGSEYVNWNCLTVEDRPAPEERSATDTMIYYGSYRVNREKYFDRYFRDPQVPVVISCPNSKFSDRYFNPKIEFESKLQDLYEYLGHFGLGLYIEDRLSHIQFHSPANRFYEMLSAHLPMVFQSESRNMMSEAGFDVSEFVAADIPTLMEKSADIGRTQRERWWPTVIASRTALGDTITNLWSKIK